MTRGDCLHDETLAREPSTAYTRFIMARPTTSSASRAVSRPLGNERRLILTLLRGYGAKRIRVFGSFARGEQRATSDIDLLVDLPARISLLDLVGIKNELEEKLGRRVDLLTEDGLSPYLRDRILREAQPL